MAEPKPYLCSECGYVIGFIMRGNDRRPKLSVMRNGCHITQLGTLGDPLQIQYAVSSLEHGIIHCAMCGAQRVWSMSDQSLSELISRRKQRTFGLE